MSKAVPRRRRRGHRASQRGVAFLLALSTLTLLTISVVEFQEEQTADLQSAYAARDALQAEYMARSAVNLSRLFLASEPVIKQSLPILQFIFPGGNVPQIPIWEYSDSVLGAFNDKDGQRAFADLGNFDMSTAKNLGGPEGARFNLVIVDEDAKLSLNQPSTGTPSAQDQFARSLLGLMNGIKYDPLFERKDRDGNLTDRLTVCSALVDWADQDENRYGCDPFNFHGGSAPAGAEDQSYGLLPRPYRAKNAPFDSLEEAHLVRGMDDDFWATFVDPDPTMPKKRVFTVWGGGAINVNTSPVQAVMAVVCGQVKDAPLCNSPDMFLQFLTRFGMARSIMTGIPMFARVGDFISFLQGGGQTANPNGFPLGPLIFGNGEIPPVKFQSPAEAAKYFTTRSDVFSIYATGEVKGFHRTTRVRIHAVVDRRSAPGIPDSAIPGVPPGSTAPMGAGATPMMGAGAATGALANLPPGAGADAIARVLTPDPAGQIVYFRIE